MKTGTCFLRLNGVRLDSALILTLGLALAGCGSGDQASKMTSYSTAESAEAKAELFSLPADQMTHIQVVAVEQGPLAPAYLISLPCFKAAASKTL